MKKAIRFLLLAIMTTMSAYNISAKVISDNIVADIVGEMTLNDASIDGK